MNIVKKIKIFLAKYLFGEGGYVSYSAYRDLSQNLGMIYEKMIEEKSNHKKEIVEKEAEILKWKTMALERQKYSGLIGNRSE